MNILSWTHWRILDVSENTNDYCITAEQEAVVSCCPHCASSLLYGHGTKTQRFMDTPIRGKRVGILVIRRRYKCRECSKTFLEELSDMNEHHSMTKRLVLYLSQQSLRHPFTRVADDVGIDERTVRRIGDCCHQLE